MARASSILPLPSSRRKKVVRKVTKMIDDLSITSTNEEIASSIIPLPSSQRKKAVRKVEEITKMIDDLSITSTNEEIASSSASSSNDAIANKQNSDTSALSEFKFPDFSELNVSTITVVVYTNIFFKFLDLFHQLPITSNSLGYVPSKNRKKKLVNKKDLEVPYGSIVMVNSGNHIRGLDMRKTKKRHWCFYTCRLTQRKGEKIVKINTVIEEHVPVGDGEMKEIHYFCTNCKQYYTLKQLDKICNFLNQLTVVLSIGNGTYLSIMIFSNKIKIAGCRRKSEAYEAIMILWENYIRGTKCYLPLELYNNIPDEKPADEVIDSAIEKYNSSDLPSTFVPKFLFRTVMRNVGFNLGFYIDRQQFNDMMKEYSKTGKLVKTSFCDTTAHPNVRTKYYTYRPIGHTYRVLSIPQDKDAFFENCSANTFKMVDNTKKPKKDKKKTELLTAIVFSSSQVIFSSRNKYDSNRIYKHVIEAIKKHRQVSAEKSKEEVTQIDDFDPLEFKI